MYDSIYLALACLAWFFILTTPILILVKIVIATKGQNVTKTIGQICFLCFFWLLIILILITSSIYQWVYFVVFPSVLLWLFLFNIKLTKKNIVLIFSILFIFIISILLDSNLIFGQSEKVIREFHLAAIKNDIPALKAWIDKGYDVDASYDTKGTWHQSGTTGTTALIYAASNGNYDAVKLLVDAGANLYAQTRDSSIHFEMDKRHKVFEITNSDNKLTKLKYYYTGNSAFDAAISGGHTEIAKTLWLNSDKIVYTMKDWEHFSVATGRYCRSSYYNNKSYREMLVFLTENVINEQTINDRLSKMRDQDCAEKINKIIDPDLSQQLRTAYFEKLYSESHRKGLLEKREKDGTYSYTTMFRIYNSFFCSKYIAVSNDDNEYIYEHYCKHFIEEKTRLQELIEKWSSSSVKRNYKIVDNKIKSYPDKKENKLACYYYGDKKIIEYKIEEIFEYCDI